MIEKMKFLTIYGAKEDIDRVILQYLCHYTIQYECAFTKYHDSYTLTKEYESNPYTDALKKAQEISTAIDTQQDNIRFMEIQNAIQFIETLYVQFKHYELDNSKKLIPSDESYIQNQHFLSVLRAKRLEILSALKTLNHYYKCFDIRKFAAFSSSNLKGFPSINEDIPGYILCGFIPDRNIRHLTSDLTYDTNILFELEDPKSLTFNTPVLLKNPMLFRSFEEITRLYLMPTYQLFDPTIAYALCYSLLYGFLLGDFAVGLILCFLGGYLCYRCNLYKFGILNFVGFFIMIIGIIQGTIWGKPQPLLLHLLPVVSTSIQNVILLLLTVITFCTSLIILFFRIKLSKQTTSLQVKNEAAKESIYSILLSLVLLVITCLGLSINIIFFLIYEHLVLLNINSFLLFLGKCVCTTIEGFLIISPPYYYSYITHFLCIRPNMNNLFRPYK